MKILLPIRKLFSLVVTVGLLMGSPLVKGESVTLSQTNVHANGADNDQGYFSEGSENIKQEVECKTTAKGVRCKNHNTGKSSLIKTSEMMDNNQYQARVEEICKNSSRGNRCKQQVGIMLKEYDGQEMAYTEENICKYTARGSRC